MKGKLILSPMAGISDAAFRLICQEYSCDVTITEMVSSKALYFRDKKTEKIMQTYPEEKNVILQIFGRDPEIMARVTEEQINSRNDFIGVNVNMGCPAPKIVKNGEGSALLKEPDLAEKIVRNLVRVSNKPVSVKYRLGIGGEENFLEMGKRFEDAGASFLILHPRTREDYYRGRADRKKLALLKEELSIPLIANGDVDSPESYLDMLEETGIGDVAIGRGARGNPFIFSQIKSFMDHGTYEKPSIKEIIKTVENHYRLLIDLKGERRAILEMRKHIGWYFKGLKGSNKLKSMINQEEDMEKIFLILEDFERDILEV